MTAINSVLGGKSRPGGTAVAPPNSVLNCAWMIIASSFYILGLWIRVEGAGGGAEMEMEKEEGNREILDEDVCGGGSLLLSHADDWNRDPWMSFRMSVREMVLGSCLSFLFTRNCVKFNLGSKLCFFFWRATIRYCNSIFNHRRFAGHKKWTWSHKLIWRFCQSKQEILVPVLRNSPSHRVFSDTCIASFLYGIFMLSEVGRERNIVISWEKGFHKKDSLE